MSNTLKEFLLGIAAAEIPILYPNKTDEEIEEMQDDLYDEYEDQQFISYIYYAANPNSKTQGDINLIIDVFSMTIPMVMAILYLMCQRQRKRLCHNCTNGYFALLVPINLLEGRKKRRAYVAAFALTISNILDMIGEQKPSGFSEFTKVLEELLIVSIIAMRFLPLLACVYLASLPSCVVGLLYMVIILVVNFIKEIPAPGMKKKIIFKETFVPTIVHLIAGAYLIYWFLKYLNFHRQKISVSPEDELSNEVEYVKHLLTRERDFLKQKEIEEQKQHNVQSKIVKLFQKYIYKPVPGFSYALTILISCTIAFFGITHIGVNFIYEFIKDLDQSFSILDNHLPHFKTKLIPNYVGMFLKDVTPTAKNIKERTDVTLYSFIYTQCLIFLVCVPIAAVTAYIYCIFTILHMLKTYRENVLNLAKQKPRQKILRLEEDFSNINLVTSAISFGGYQVAYLVAGFIIQFLTFLFIFFVIGEIIILPIQFAFKSFVIKIIEIVSPMLIALVVVEGSQYLLVKFVFLENRGKTLAINNRRAFFIMTYFVFFLNIFTGLISCVKRILKGTFFGISLISRLDKSVFPRTFETYDAVYESYSCLLRLEALQSNAIVRSFAYLLLKRHCNVIHHDSQNYFAKNVVKGLVTPKSKRLAQIRWFVLYTLVRNPGIAFTMKKWNKLGVMEVYTHTPVEIMKNEEIEAEKNEDIEDSKSVAIDI